MVNFSYKKKNFKLNKQNELFMAYQPIYLFDTISITYGYMFIVICGINVLNNVLQCYFIFAGFYKPLL